MRTCPLGHENTDEATTCAVCLRRLDTAPVTLDLLLTGASPPAAEAGTSTVLPLALRQDGGEAMHCALSATGAHGDWVSPAVVTSTPGAVVPVALTVTVPADEGAGPREITVLARPGDHEVAPARRVLELHVRPAVQDRTDVPPQPPPPQPPAPPRPAPPRPQPLPPDPVDVWHLSQDAPTEPTRPVPPPPPPRRPDHVPSRWPFPTGDQDRSRPHRSRRRGGRRAAVLVALGVVLIAAVGVWQVLGRAPSARSALDLTESEAVAELVQERDRDREELRAFLSVEGSFALQLSSKCRDLEEVDLTGTDGIGHPDGTPERIPGGVGSNGILAFHRGIDRSRGTTLLATADDLGPPRPCDDGSTRWITLHLPASGPFDSPEKALCGCADRRAPFGECGARGSDGTILFWLPRTVPGECRDRVEDLSGAPPRD